MFVKTEVRDSGIFGKGLYALEAIRRATIVCFFPIGAGVIDEARYLRAIEQDERDIIRTGTRYAGRYFTHGNEQEPYTFINHSFSPNLLCHCGIVVSRNDIDSGQELTLDYRYLVDDTDMGVYQDAVSGRPIKGLSARETFLATARQMIALVESDEQWRG